MPLRKVQQADFYTSALNIENRFSSAIVENPKQKSIKMLQSSSLRKMRRCRVHLFSENQAPLTVTRVEEPLLLIKKN